MTQQRCIQKPCEACGATIPADGREVKYARFFCCQAVTARVGEALPDQCLINKSCGSEDTRAALAALPRATASRHGEKLEVREARKAILLRYIHEVGSGEPTLAWYRSIVKDHRTITVTSALSALPYWKATNLRFPTINCIHSIDQQVNKWRGEGNCPEFAELLGGYVEHLYDLMEFGFQHGQFREEAAVKLSTIAQMVFKVGHYLKWLNHHGHRDLREAGRTWLSRYMAEFEGVRNFV